MNVVLDSGQCIQIEVVILGICFLIVKSYASLLLGFSFSFGIPLYASSLRRLRDDLFIYFLFALKIYI